MPVSGGMYQQQQGPDIFGSFATGLDKGIRLADLARQSKVENEKVKEEEQLKDIAKKNVVVGPDGKASLNQDTYLSDLAKVNPVRAIEEQRAFRAQAVADQKATIDGHLQKLNVTSQLLGGVTDQASYDQAHQQAVKLGLAQPGELPDQYDPKLVQSILAKTLTYKDNLDQHWKEVDQQNKVVGQKQTDRGLDIKEKTAAATATNSAGKMTEAQSKALGFGRRATIADQMINQIALDPKADISSLKTQAKMALPKWMGGLKDQNEQTLALAKTAFIASVLRKESGAAVTKEEFETYSRIYFPEPGESTESAENKKLLRQNFIDTERLTAGNAWKDPVRSSGGGATGTWNGPKEVERKAADGKVAIFDAGTQKFLRWK